MIPIQKVGLDAGLEGYVADLHFTVDFGGLKVEASRTSKAWKNPAKRIASVNSFGYGGSNAHVVIQDADSYLRDFPHKNHVSSFAKKSIDDFFDDDDEEESNNHALVRPSVLVFSANDEASLKAYYSALRRHLIDPSVSLKLSDLAFTLSDRKSRLFHRGFVVADSLNLREDALITGKESSTPPEIGFIFTGQGAQWPQMGKALIDTYAGTRSLLAKLDEALQELPNPPAWSILGESCNKRLLSVVRSRLQMNYTKSAARTIYVSPSSRSHL